MVTLTGNGLQIIINCDNSLSQGWQALASWYSVRKNLPDADVLILCQRTLISPETFRWAFRSQAKVFQHNSNANPLEIAESNNLLKSEKTNLIINSSVMAIREFLSLITDKVSSENFSTFVDYSDGCGSFVLSDWINNMKPPFYEAVNHFSKNQITVNEIRVLKLWERLSHMYDQLY